MEIFCYCSHTTILQGVFNFHWQSLTDTWQYKNRNVQREFMQFL